MSEPAVATPEVAAEATATAATTAAPAKSEEKKVPRPPGGAPPASVLPASVPLPADWIYHAVCCSSIHGLPSNSLVCDNDWMYINRKKSVLLTI
jgi:hypothetical protein